jgi:hypothetical protein
MALTSRRRGRPLVVAALAAALGVWSAQAAEAQEGPTFEGTVWGCFFEAGDPACNPTGGDSWGFLTFHQSTFNISTTWSGGAYRGADGQTVGSFSLAAGDWDYGNGRFVLQYNFTNPGSNQTVFQAILEGSVANGDGGVTIDYQDPRWDSWVGGGYDNWVQIHDFTGVELGGTGNIDMRVRATPVPEPVSMALLGTGLFGVAFVMRRRRKSAELEETL